jgi:betaine-aldehyde dehydrogenase
MTALDAPADKLTPLVTSVRKRLESDPLQILIAGQVVTGLQRRPTLDPSTGEVLTSVPEADAATVDSAVAAALRAQSAWHALGVPGRQPILARLGRAVAEHTAELAMLDAMDGGNPYPAMVSDIERCLHQFTTWSAVAGMSGGNTVPIDPQDLHFTELAPYGVVARILAYNHPAYFAIKAMLPPLVMGNTVILKAAEQTPLSALRLAEIAQEVLPPGVLTVLSGGVEAGEALVRHRDVRRIGFTGSVGTGRAIQRSAAESAVKHVSLELGGKNAMVVFPDAPVASVARAVIAGMNLDSCGGQSCGSTSRVFVHQDIHDQVVEAVAAGLAPIVPAAAYSAGTPMGAMVSAAHRDRIAGYVSAGTQDGARIVSSVATVPDGGYFHGPVLFDGVEQSMRIAREEIFGPVISVLRWTDLDETLRQANSVDYGLTGAVWTNDLQLALRTARGLHTGYVWINDVSKHYWGMPFGGVKDSGLGREECIDELASYAETRAINVRTRW